MSAREILSAYQERLITASEAIEQAGVDSLEDLYDAAAGPSARRASRSPQRYTPMPAQASQG